MNITANATSKVSSRLTVEVTEVDYKEKVDQQLKQIGRTHQIPGFRKGHVGIADLRRRFGRQVTSDVINEVVFDAVVKYIEENKLNVLGQPIPVEVKELDLKNQKDFTFEYDLALAPEVEVDVNKDIALPYYNIEVSDDMVNEQSAAYRKRFGAQVPGEVTESDAVIKGALMQLNADGTVMEGENAIQVIAGILAPMYFTDKEQAALFENKKVGDKVIFNPAKASGGNVTEIASMLNIDKDRAATVDSDFEMAISEIIVVRPAELGEEFYAQVFGADKVHNEEEYLAAVKSNIEKELAGNSEMVFNLQARKALVEKYGNLELPDALLRTWLINRNSDLNAENIDERYPHIADDLRWQLVKEAVAKQLGVQINDDDMLEFAKATARRQFAQYGMTNMDDETITKYAQNILDDKNYRSRMIEQVGDMKLFSAVRAAVTLNTENVTLDQFKEIASKL